MSHTQMASAVVESVVASADDGVINLSNHVVSELDMKRIAAIAAQGSTSRALDVCMLICMMTTRVSDSPRLIRASSCSLSHVSAHPGTELRLYNSKINATSLTHLATHLLCAHVDSSTTTVNTSTLTLLDLGGNALGDVGAQAVAAALASNLSLKRLFMAANRITAVGVDALLRSLQQNSRSAVCELFLFGNKLGDEGAQLIGDFLGKQLRSAPGCTVYLVRLISWPC